MILSTSKNWLVAFFALSPSVVLCQSRVAQTPPMGWNSYDCFSYAVTEDQVMQNAEYMAAHLKRFGWQYVIVDYVWSAPKLGPNFAPNQDRDFKPRLAMDRYGRLLPDPDRFPSSAGGQGFRPIAERIHKLGLKFGIHLMRGIPRQAVADNSPIFESPFRASDAYTKENPCGWLNHMWGFDMTKPAAQAYLDSIFQLYASWGVDFVKVDDLSNPYSTQEVVGYHSAIQNCRRPIVLSLSPGPTPLGAGANVVLNANMWRLLGDLWDDWGQVSGAFQPIAEWSLYRGPGHWPDPDMLPLGRLRKYGPNTGPADTDSRLTKAEQRALMTLWCVSKSPLMFGGNLPETNPFTLSLITNPEVLAVNQRSVDNEQLTGGLRPMWMADMQDAKLKILAVFNRSDTPSTVRVRLSDLGIRICNARDLWQRKDLGAFQETLPCTVPAHGALLYQLYVVAPADQTETVLPSANLTGDSYEAEDPSNTLTGAARVQVDAPEGKTSGGKYVGFIGSKPENTLRFNRVRADKEADYIVAILYMSGSDRTMFVTVNGGRPQKVTFPATGGWDGRHLDVQEVRVHLNEGSNTILFSNPSDWGVNVDRIVVRPAN